MRLPGYLFSNNPFSLIHPLPTAASPVPTLTTITETLLEIAAAKCNLLTSLSLVAMLIIKFNFLKKVYTAIFSESESHSVVSDSLQPRILEFSRPEY